MTLRPNIRTLLVLLLAARLGSAETPFRMKYLGEIGHLGGDFDKRKTVNLGIAKVYVDPEGDLRLEGHDVAGMLWRVWIPRVAGVGGTDVWTADFDRNGRQDLLIAGYFPPNGRCVQESTIYTIMFDDLGQPVPWVTHSNSFIGFERPPIAVVDVNGNGRTEMVTTSCQYADPSEKSWEDRQISGIYEARNARWLPMKNVSDRPYLAAAQRQLGQISQPFDPWLKTDPADWPDFLAGSDRQETATIRALVTSRIGCGGLRIQTVDGRAVQPVDDPCSVLGHDQVMYSDGTSRQGWPFVVINSPEGRDVFLSDSARVLRNVLKMGYRFKILGDDPESPGLLWVDSVATSRVGKVSCRLQTGEPKRMRLKVEEQPLGRPDNLDITVSVGQRCFVFRSDAKDPPTLAKARNCPAIAKLQKLGISGGAITVSESTGRQVLSGKNLLRIFRSDDGGDVDTIQFEPAPGTTGTLVAAVRFNQGWLAEWRSGPRRWLVLHSGAGKPISTEMALPVDGELFDSENHEGLHFLKWVDGKPAELIIVPASVEWSRASD